MKYADSHEWISLNDQKGLVGISVHAQSELGEVVYLELPSIGDAVKAGDEVAVLESTKAAADVYSPVSGTVVRINEELCSQLNLINEDPEKAGWLYEIELSDPSELEALLPKEQYAALLE